MPLWMSVRQRRAGRQGAVAPATAIPATPHDDLRLSGSLTLLVSGALAVSYGAPVPATT